MCYLEYDERPRVWSETTRVARKPHQCDSCRRVIYATETYMVHFSVFDDRDTYQEKMCSWCKAMRDEFSAAHEGMMPLPSGFAETLVQCIAEGDEESETVWRPMLNEINERRASRAVAH